VGLLVHKGDEKDPGPDQFLELGDGREAWIVSGRTELSRTPPDVDAMARGDLSRRRAHWVSRDVLVWKTRVPEGGSVRLHAARDGGMTLAADGVKGADHTFELAGRDGMSDEVAAHFPHLRGRNAFTLPPAAVQGAAELLRGQVIASVSDTDGNLRDATSLQIPGVLDDLFATDAPLGVQWAGDVPSLHVWAPTARTVTAVLFRGPGDAQPAHRVPLQAADGVWSVTGTPEWEDLYYAYDVEVYVPSAGSVRTHRSTDPYSRALSRNSTLSQIIDLDDARWKPDGWDDFAKPELAAPEDIVLYELHVRDFSAFDPDVPETHRGTYLAFADEGNGRRHLRRLADAGLTHVHLLPTFDIATVNEDRSTWTSPGDLAGFPPDSERQQAAVDAIRGEDGFNWGYDPYHYGVPEGSYATEPGGGARVREFRTMIQALADDDLRVVMDVVYNHTHAAGEDPRAVLDLIVPGYYHRLNDDGFVETSTCCQNTASEHRMMERLMVDDLEHWATDYRVDGFRFDLMGHHMKSNLVAARDRLAALTPEADGVDGSAIYLYGEGWDFGEVGGGARGVNATQPNLAGSGIGTFNDRIRDAVRGGNPFGDRREQGFATGLNVMPSAWSRGSGNAGRDKALAVMDRVRVGLAGNLRDFRFTGRSGLPTRGGEHDNGGYTADPQESINYVSAHDNETLFDKIQFAAPADATLEDRRRMQAMALATIALGQGVPFFHAGSEMLRSKSMDRDSYDSGDWFNRLDFTYESANFGVGLPIADKNAERWDVIRPLLANDAITPDRAAIEATVAAFEELLRIRASSPLFRMREAREIQSRLTFRASGREATPGLLVMSLNDRVPGPPDADPDVEEILVIFNARPEAAEWTRPEAERVPMELHPVQAESADERTRSSTYDTETGRFTVPAWTTAVFVASE
jgi:pullulanase-type alpha-1,6-glucosidase